MNFRVGFTFEIKKSHRNESREWETLAMKKFWSSRNFYWYETKFLVSENYANFRVMLDNSLVFVRISYSQWEVIIFLFYKKLNAIPSKNSVLNRGISLILLVFVEIIYLRKMNMNLNTINCGKVHFSGMRHENRKFCWH